MRTEPTSREAALLAELQHRVRNTLARTRAIARHSAETSENLEDYVAHLDGRLAALGRVQNAAILDPMAGIELSAILSDEITSACLGSSPRVQIEGPALALHPRAAEPFALAIHELMTNALKFGALSGPKGRLSVSWHIEAARMAPQTLIFEWTESGHRLAEDQGRRRGFGTVVLFDMLEHDLGARTDLSFDAGGLACRIVVPLTDRVLPRDVD